jgi:N-acetylmuramoyl-L-alanine amidase
MKLHSCIYLCTFILLFLSCSSQKRLGLGSISKETAQKYARTNKYYNAVADTFALSLTSTALPMLVDSLGNPIGSEWVGAVNAGMRKPNYVIIHYTAQDSVEQTLKTFTVRRSKVSIHYVVGKDGKVWHMVNDYLLARQAGVGKWGNITDMNSCSIGIEMDNNGFEPYTDAQIQSLTILLSFLKKAYDIPTANFIGHQDWAPKRKPDPGPLFPWEIMAEHGFGLWHDEVLEVAPPNFEHTMALRVIGYDTSDLKAAITAFKRHFVQSDLDPKLTQLDLNILYNLFKKY